VSKTKKTQLDQSTGDEKEFGFSFEALKEHSKDLFGVKPEILEGALFYIKHQPITKTEAKKHIDAFLSKEV